MTSSTKAADQPKLSPRREQAVDRVKRIEDGLLHVQATIPGYVREATELRELLEGKDGEDATTERGSEE